MTIQYFGKRYRGQSTERSTPIQAGKGRRSVLSIVSRLIVFLQIVFIILPIVTIVYLSFTETSSNKEAELINIIQSIRNKYREEKNYAESDKIRDELKKIGITLNDRR